MAHLTKKLWTTPKVRHFETPEEIWAFYESIGSGEREKLEELLDQMRESHRSRSQQAKLRKSANG